jgi:hypothetical protein
MAVFSCTMFPNSNKKDGRNGGDDESGDEGDERVCESWTAPSSLREGIRASSPIFHRPVDESSPASPSISGEKDFVRAQLTSASPLSLPKLIVAVDGAVNRGFARMRAGDDLLVEDGTIVDRVSSLLCPPKDNVRAGVTLNPSIAGLDDNVQIEARRRLARSAHSKLVVQQLSMKDESKGMSDSSPSLSSSPSSSPIRWGKRVAGVRIKKWSSSNDFMTNDRHYPAFLSPAGFKVMHRPARTKTIRRLLFPLTNDEGDRICESRTASPSRREGIAASSPVSLGSTNESSLTYPRPLVSNNDAHAGVAKNLFDVDQKPPPPCPQPRGGIADDDGERIEVMRRSSGAATDLSTTMMLRKWLSPMSNDEDDARREGLVEASPNTPLPANESSSMSLRRLISGVDIGIVKTSTARAKLTSTSSPSVRELIATVDGTVNRGLERRRTGGNHPVDVCAVVGTALSSPPLKDDIRAGVTTNPMIADLDVFGILETVTMLENDRCHGDEDGCSMDSPTGVDRFPSRAGTGVKIHYYPSNGPSVDPSSVPSPSPSPGPSCKPSAILSSHPSSGPSVAPSSVSSLSSSSNPSSDPSLNPSSYPSSGPGCFPSNDLSSTPRSNLGIDLSLNISSNCFIYGSTFNGCSLGNAGQTLPPGPVGSCIGRP